MEAEKMWRKDDNTSEMIQGSAHAVSLRRGNKDNLQDRFPNISLMELKREHLVYFEEKHKKNSKKNRSNAID